VAWDPTAYATHAAFVPALGTVVFDLLAPATGERILDLGCGDGVLTERLVGAGAAVVGVDADRAMVAAAAARGLDVRPGDGRRLAFAAEFDAVFRRTPLDGCPGPGPCRRRRQLDRRLCSPALCRPQAGVDSCATFP